MVFSHWFDIFPNVDKAKLVTAPVFIMHGTADKEIPIHHGIGISENVQVQYPPYDTHYTHYTLHVTRSFHI